MSYQHGIQILENPTSIIAPLTCDSGIQIIIGTAPINMIKNPQGAVNKPMLCNSFAEAVTNVGYSDDFEKFTLCQSIDASFRVFNVAPIILINVLDPTKHSVSVKKESLTIVNGIGIIKNEGVLLSSIVVSTNSSTVLVLNTDYVVSFDDMGMANVALITTQASVNVDYSYLDPTLVTLTDIIGGYNATTAKYEGLELIEQIFPLLSMIPGQIVVPGFSHLPEVCAVIGAKTENINGCYSCTAVVDIDTSLVPTYDKAIEWKNQNGYTNKNVIACYPMLKIGNKKYYMSAIWSALTAFVDASNGSVPFQSPSNQMLPITGTILFDGTELNLDQLQGNFLNGGGICTAINIDGWRSWGNNTSIYPASTDVKDRFIPVRRMFSWWGNTFIRTYFQKVDSPMNFRLIEAIVDSENIRANGLQARGQIGSGKITFSQDENPETSLLNGQITFHQYLAFFTPAEFITNILEFDPTALSASLFGGAN